MNDIWKRDQVKNWSILSKSSDVKEVVHYLPMNWIALGKKLAKFWLQWSAIGICIYLNELLFSKTFGKSGVTFKMYWKQDKMHYLNYIGYNTNTYKWANTLEKYEIQNEKNNWEIEKGMFLDSTPISLNNFCAR